MKKTLLTLAMGACLAIPSISEARGGSFGGGYHGSSFHSSSYSHSSSFGYSSRSSYASRPSFGGSYAVKNNPGSSYSKSYSAMQTSRNTPRVTTINNYRDGGNNGFFTGMMMGSMMNHPYYYGGGYGYGMGYPPYYMGGYGYDLVGGYGVNGYMANGAYYPYSPVGLFFSWLFGLLSVFFVVYFMVVLLQLFWKFAMSDDFLD